MAKLKISKALILANLLVIGLVIYLLAGITAIPLIEPENGVYMTERAPEFVWGGPYKQFELLVDDDPDFTSPFAVKVSDNSFRFSNNLDFGTYYWKVRSGVFESGVRKFTLGSSVVLAREKNEVRNEGNTDVVLHRVTGAMVLGVGSSVKIGEGETVKGEQA